MSNFDYQKPASVAEATTLLSSGATALAGGMTLLPTIKQGLASPATLVDLAGIEDLRGIREDAVKGIVIGAMTTHAEVADSDLIQSKLPAVSALARMIGDPQVRHRGTIGGSLANNDPAADYPSALLGLNGSVHTSKREISADEFFTGLFSTALEEDEVILHLHLPLPESAAYAKFPQPASRYALVGVFVAKTSDGSRVAVTGAGSDGVFRSKALEEALSGSFNAAAIDGVTVSADNLISDIHGSAAYRANLVSVMAKRALAG